MENSKNKKKVIIIIILCVLISFISGFIVYDKIIKKPTKDEVNSLNKVEEQNKLEVSLEKAKTIYYRILFGNREKEILEVLNCSSGYDYPHMFYGSKKLVIKEDIDYNFLMGFAYSYIPTNQIIQENNKTKFLVKDIKKIYESYFGENNDWHSFNVWIGRCDVEGEYYVCKNDETPFGDECYADGILTTFVNYETDKENLYIYDKSIYFRTEDEKIMFYNSEDYENEIIELSGKDKKIILDDTYNDKMLWYMHTFKQNKDGTFYLYSTEPIQPN